MIWSTFAVIVAESDLPSKMNTSAPYLSLAYFCASVACPWWNTFVMSDTKNAIFFGLSVAGLYSVAAGAAGSGALRRFNRRRELRLARPAQQGLQSVRPALRRRTE